MNAKTAHITAGILAAVTRTVFLAREILPEYASYADGQQDPNFHPVVFLAWDGPMFLIVRGVLSLLGVHYVPGALWTWISMDALFIITGGVYWFVLAYLLVSIVERCSRHRGSSVAFALLALLLAVTIVVYRHVGLALMSFVVGPAVLAYGIFERRHIRRSASDSRLSAGD